MGMMKIATVLIVLLLLLLLATPSAGHGHDDTNYQMFVKKFVGFLADPATKCIIHSVSKENDPPASYCGVQSSQRQSFSLQTGLYIFVAANLGKLPSIIHDTYELGNKALGYAKESIVSNKTETNDTAKAEADKKKENKKKAKQKKAKQKKARREKKARRKKKQAATEKDKKQKEKENAAAENAKAKAEAQKAKAQAEKAKAQAEKAKVQAEKAKAEAEKAFEMQQAAEFKNLLFGLALVFLLVGIGIYFINNNSKNNVLAAVVVQADAVQADAVQADAVAARPMIKQE